MSPCHGPVRRTSGGRGRGGRGRPDEPKGPALRFLSSPRRRHAARSAQLAALVLACGASAVGAALASSVFGSDLTGRVDLTSTTPSGATAVARMVTGTPSGQGAGLAPSPSPTASTARASASGPAAATATSPSVPGSPSTPSMPGPTAITTSSVPGGRGADASSNPPAGPTPPHDAISSPTPRSPSATPAPQNHLPMSRELVGSLPAGYRLVLDPLGAGHRVRLLHDGRVVLERLVADADLATSTGGHPDPLDVLELLDPPASVLDLLEPPTDDHVRTPLATSTSSPGSGATR